MCITKVCAADFLWSYKAKLCHYYLLTTDPRELEQFTRHVLGLGLEEQLVPLLSALEEEHRRRLHPAEEELEGVGRGGEIIDAMVFLALL